MSNTAESSVGGNLEVVRVIEHTRNKDIWDHYDLCEMSNGSRRARCKLCLKFLASEGNTTLKNHLTKSCKALRSRSDPSQSNLTPQGGVLFTTTKNYEKRLQKKEAQFPILAAMARDLLTVQASTVASESAFSVSGMVISQRRSRLSPESVEVCICLKDYLDGAARKQHITTLEDAIDADLEANLHIEEVELGYPLQTKKAKMMKKRWQCSLFYNFISIIGGIGTPMGESVPSEHSGNLGAKPFSEESKMKNQILEQVIGVPMKSTLYQIERTPRRYLPDTAGQYRIPSSAEGSNKFIKGKGNLMKKLGKKADTFAHGVREHVRLGPKITETVKRNDRAIKIPSPNGEFLRVHYKVLIPHEKIKRVNDSENMKRPSQKYMDIVTVDDFDFWFMGFLNYQKAFKYLQQAISQRLMHDVLQVTF
ncbi:GEM-like protein 7 [Hibiscus syriacus]|uniref:GEM-like protein 7 n=1 Tax=Hibiscus syriacus TaxID=106335 RepID=A0A6A3CJM3_HIBSY|nr:GEM-like protein 7 [Hibiscus syriacus]